MSDIYYIKDPKSSKLGILLFEKHYHMQGLVYLEEDKPSYCSNVVKWLDKLQIRTTSQKKANKLAFEFLRKKYPNYKDYIQLF